MPAARYRIAQALAVTFAALVVGILSDVFASGSTVSFGDAALAVLFSPLLAITGGSAVVVTPELSFVLGLLFWPVWFVLVRDHVRGRGRAWRLAVLGAWSVQGFFTLVTRFQWIMSA